MLIETVKHHVPGFICHHYHFPRLSSVNCRQQSFTHSPHIGQYQPVIKLYVLKVYTPKMSEMLMINLYLGLEHGWFLCMANTFTKRRTASNIHGSYWSVMCNTPQLYCRVRLFHQNLTVGPPFFFPSNFGYSECSSKFGYSEYLYFQPNQELCPMDVLVNFSAQEKPALTLIFAKPT